MHGARSRKGDNYFHHYFIIIIAVVIVMIVINDNCPYEESPLTLSLKSHH